MHHSPSSRPPRTQLKRIKLGVLANEFFDLSLGRMGGFGWAVGQLARFFRQHPEHGIDLVFLTGEVRGLSGQREIEVHQTRLILKQSSRLINIQRARAERLDALLLIDYRPNYRLLCWAMPRTPMIVWVRDPRPPEDLARISSLRIPGAEDVRPKGIVPLDCTSLGTITRAARIVGRPIAFASPEPQLRHKLAATIGVEVDEFFDLPNPIDLDPGEIRKSPRPQVIFLARLDPHKRPWIFAELARRFPDVEFLFAGRTYHSAPGVWEPRDLAANVRMLNHVDGREKVRALSSAWMLVNTAIHEGLAVSFLESLACETPLIACVDPGNVVSRFGIYAGQFDGAGMDALGPLTAAVERMLSDHEMRVGLGRAGRVWVRETHSWPRFVACFNRLLVQVGVR
jgi:glycosyltransferase involved in cell wall biosynthesis